jgi:hypothetical protein
MLDAVSDLLGRFESLVHRGSGTVINFELLDNVVDDLTLGNSFLTLSLPLFDSSDDQD